MKHLLLVAIVLFSGSFNHYYGGCGAIRVCANNNTNFIYLPQKQGEIPTYFVDITDSIRIEASQHGSCNIPVVNNIEFNGKAMSLPAFYTSFPVAWFYLPNKPGNYKIYLTITGLNIVSGVFEYNITDKITVGLNDQEQDSHNITISPNPANSYLWISCSKSLIKNISIFDSAGKPTHIACDPTKVLNIPIENLPAGFYLVMVATVSKKVVVKKLLVQ